MRQSRYGMRETRYAESGSAATGCGKAATGCGGAATESGSAANVRYASTCRCLIKMSPGIWITKLNDKLKHIGHSAAPPPQAAPAYCVLL